LYGDKYRIIWDEARIAPSTDPWLALVKCRIGTIGPFGDGLLVASVDRHPRLAAKIGQLPFCRVHQLGDDGANIVFPVERFAEVAELMGACRRRRLSPERAAAVTAQLAKWRTERAA
jgi:hypothetical protein